MSVTTLLCQAAWCVACFMVYQLADERLGQSGMHDAQVRSRFAEPSGQGEDFGPFLHALQGLGFRKVAEDTSNSYFVTFELRKSGSGSADSSQSWPRLKPCMYKKR